MAKLEEDDELRSEYKLQDLGKGVRGRYLDRYQDGNNLVRLDPDVASAFPDDASVNEALRAVLQARRAA